MKHDLDWKKVGLQQVWPAAAAGGNPLERRNYRFKKISNNLLKEKHPSMNFIKKDDVSSLAYYLTTNQASQITGSNLIIDGGWTAQ